MSSSSSSKSTELIGEGRGDPQASHAYETKYKGVYVLKTSTPFTKNAKFVTCGSSTIKDQGNNENIIGYYVTMKAAAIAIDRAKLKINAADTDLHFPSLRHFLDDPQTINVVVVKHDVTLSSSSSSLSTTTAALGDDADDDDDVDMSGTSRRNSSDDEKAKSSSSRKRTFESAEDEFDPEAEDHDDDSDDDVTQKPPPKKRAKKSAYIGASKNTKGNKYAARIRIDGKVKGLGSSYATAKQAGEAYDKKAIKLGKPLSKLNFPKKAPVGYTPIQQALVSWNTIGYRGVSKNGNKFKGQIGIGSKKIGLGTFETAKEAAIMYDRAVLKANQSTTLLNFPDMVHNLDVEPKREYKRSSTGYRGVTKYGNTGTFAARFSIGGKRVIVGIFDTEIAAALAYDQAAIKAGKKKSSLNFPDGLPIKQESDLDDGEGFWV